MIEFLKNMGREYEWINVIFPGVLSMVVIEFVSSAEISIDFRFIIFSLVMTYVNLTIVGMIDTLIQRVRKKEFKVFKFSILATSYLTTTFVTSVLMGYLIGVAVEKDVFYGLMNRLPITTSVKKVSHKRPLMVELSKYGENTNRRTDWISIKTKDGTIYEGWPKLYDLTGEETELYLSPACVYDGEKTNYNIEGIVVFESGAESILFIKDSESDCSNHTNRN